MHYYTFNIGDYRRDTAHLVPMEHYIYRTLIDWYFLNETAIPNETQSVMRRLSLDFSYEKNLLNVLNDFFVLLKDGWHHKRVDQEIQNFHQKSEKNKANGIKGGRPIKTQSVILANPIESKQNPNQEPITNNQEPIKANTTSSSPEKTPSNDVIPFEKIINLYHEILPTNPKVALLTNKRKGHIAARWKSGLMPDIDAWEQLFVAAKQSKFLTGGCDPVNGHPRFVADIDWLINENNIAKVAEGKYLK